MSYMDKIMEYLDKDAVVSKLGLEPKHSAGDKIVSALGSFGVGVLVGAGVALLLAPKSGRDLREGIRNKMSGEGFTPGAESTSEMGLGTDSARRPV